jgi:hypothetical protein
MRFKRKNRELEQRHGLDASTPGSTREGRPTERHDET